ncbi:unnamed protein product [Hydatigera taeniaeformis]|uniref:XPG_I_2 domain-containing protein n=1 Tax=Hydatigena taeniaeformis TaxID=6205 RepID=A0A0R3X969_HYDTA|nr:unnamed protein product [Hydatigera taeniaeformis]
MLWSALLGSSRVSPPRVGVSRRASVAAVGFRSGGVTALGSVGCEATSVDVDMLIHSDIWTLIEQEVTAFQTIQVYDTTVVINAHDFIRNVIRSCNHPQHHGGDYLQMREDFAKILDIFNQCNIRPIFVFGGAFTMKASRLQENVRLLQKRTSILVSSLQHVHASNQVSRIEHSNGSSYTPVFSKETFVEILNEMDFPHVTCDADSTSACVALAAYLRCPLVANSNDLFLFEFEEPSDHLNCFVYIPLRFLSSQPVPQSLNPQSQCLVAHAFSPSNSSIHRVPYVLRPFFAIFFKPPNGSYFPLPHRIRNNLGSRETADKMDSIRPMVRRARELVSWLESIDSLASAFDESVKQLEKNAISMFMEQLVEITLALKIDLRQGEDLARYLFPDAKPREQWLMSSTDLITSLAQQPSRFKHIKQYVSANTTESCTSECEMAKLLSKVPHKFLQLYRSSFLSPVIFTRLLSGVVVFPVLGENPALDSVMETCAGIRYLQYCLALDFIRRYREDLVPLNGCAESTLIEISRSINGLFYRRRVLKLKPSPLPTAKGSATVCASYVYKNIGYQIKSVGNWIEMLALTLTLWHGSHHSDVKFNILNQTTALAVALVACAVEASNGSLNFGLLNDLANDMVCDYKVNVVHEINEIQLVYISTVSLLRLVNVISVCEDINNEVLIFPQGRRFFPNSRLIHNLAVTLKGSQDRELLHIWLERLLSPIHNVGYVQKATESMIHLIRMLCEMWTMQPIGLLSRCDFLQFPALENQYDGGKKQGEAAKSPLQQMYLFHHGPDLQSGRNAMHVTCSSARRTERNRANDKTSGHTVYSCESSNKDMKNSAIKPTAGEPLEKRGAQLMQCAADGLHRKCGRTFGSHSKAGFGRSGPPEGSGSDNAGKGKGGSTNPFLSDYFPKLSSSQCPSPLNTVKPKNPFLLDFDPPCQRAATECCEREDSGRLNPFFNGQRRNLVTSPYSGHVFRTYKGRCFQPTSESGHGFSNQNKEDGRFNAIGEVSPSCNGTNAAETSTRPNSEQDCKDRSYASSDDTSQFWRNNPGCNVSGPRAPFNRKYPFRSYGNNCNNSKMNGSKRQKPFNGSSRRGRSFNFGKGGWNPSDIADAVEKLALDFS